MRPDRIIVGEVRGGETLDMLQAINTGHEGSLATVHANSCETHRPARDAGDDGRAGHPVETLRDQINTAIDVMVQL